MKILFKYLSLLLFLCGLYFNAISQTSGNCTTTTASTIGGHSVVFMGATYAGTGATATTTFTYQVTSGFSPSISHFDFGNSICSSCFDDASDFQSVTGGIYEIGTDPIANLCGIKYDFAINGGETKTVSFTLKGTYDIGTITFGVKAGTNVEYAPICGPACVAPTLSIGNQIWNDANGNGLYDATELGISGVAIKLYLDANGDNIVDGAAIATTTTDGQGKYVFSGLSANNYIVGVIMPTGFASTITTATSSNPDNDINNDNNGITTINGELRSNHITLSYGGEPTNGNTNNTVDFGLRNIGSIGDFVWNDANGNGIQDAGEAGLIGVTVTLTYFNGTVISTTTGTNGFYLFSNLAPGTYTITFSTPNSYVPTLSNQGTNDAKDSDPVNGSVSVTLTTGQTNLTVDAGFYPQLSLGNTVWLDISNNGFKDTNEPGIAGATVNLYLDANNDNTADGLAIAATTTDASGNYNFTGLTANNYIVGVVIPSGYTLVTTNGGDADNNIDNDNNGISTLNGEARSLAITLSVQGEPTNDGDGNNGNLTLDFALKGNGSIGNFVWADYNGNGIQNAGEPGLEGVVVTLTFPSGQSISTTTDPNGNYLFSNLPAGTYNVNFTSPIGATPSPASQGTDNTKDSDPVADNVTVVLASGQNRSDIDAGFVCCIETLSLGDLVWIDANGNGIKDATEVGFSGATVTLYRDNNGDNVPDAAAIATTTTNANGLYNFSNLAAGKYIVGVTIPAGYIASSTTGTSAFPDNSVDLDNNGVTVISGELRSNYLTLTAANYTLDFGIRTSVTGAGSIGDYVWNDLNKNGIQDAGEPPIANVSVTLTYPNATTIITTTNSNGYYIFNNLSSGTYTLTFATPQGMLATIANQGTDDTKDSDPVNGSVSVVLATNQNITDVDAGFYLKPPVISNCGAGYVTKKTTLVTNGNFSITNLSPGAGNNFSGIYATPGFAYSYAGGSFKAQAQYTGTNTVPNTERSFSLINSATNYASGAALQAPFPGDAVNGVAASNTWMYHNGNDLGGEALVWEQAVTGLTIGKTYRFRFYATNTINDGSLGYNDPIVKIRIAGTSGLPDGTVVTGPVTLTEAATANSAALSGWYRMEYAFTASATSMIFKITDAQTSTSGDDLGITAIGIDVCERDTDGDGIADVDDIDADNDGILNTVESGGYDPFGDCDGDGIPNYKDPTPGCTTPSGNDIYGKPYVALTWTDCNGDGINDFFDFDGDGIINALDLDSDNDGIPDILETKDPKAIDNNNDGMADGIDADGDGLMSSADANDAVAGGPGLTPQDLDKDGKPNYLDLDSDGDGITDLTEATGVYDTDGIANGTDTDGDGMRGGYTNAANVADNFNGFGGRGIRPIDSDNDGKPDAYDIDSDNDGIPDNVEAQATCSYKLPTGIDTDGDGVDNAYDLANNSCSKTSAGLTPFDKDADGDPDYLDLDSDNDGAPDVNEASGISGNFVTNKNDTDGDGLIDQFDGFNMFTTTSNYHYNVTNSNMGPLGNFDGPVPTASMVQLVKSIPGDCSTGDRDWRECTILPVTLIEFRGNLNNNTTKLMWKVTKETNMNYYDVERSIDGTNFIKVANITATNASVATSIINYSINDDVLNIGSTIVYYRLKMMEKSGKYKFSNVLNFKLNSKGKVGIVVHPNPAVSFFNLKISVVKDAVATIRIMDLSGRIMVTQTSKVAIGTNVFAFNNLSNFSAGAYNVQVMMDGELYNEKLIVAK